MALPGKLTDSGQTVGLGESGVRAGWPSVGLSPGWWVAALQGGGGGILLEACSQELHLFKEESHEVQTARSPVARE